MKSYDVIISGAGPAGLRCAEILAPSGLSILILEKNAEIGTKVCAGGVTRKIFRIYNLPDSLVEQRINKITIQSPAQKYTIQHPEPFVFTLDRQAFGQWQAGRLENTRVEIRTKAQVTGIGKGFAEVNRRDKYGFRYLVGADGAASFVRRHLKIPSRKKIITFQYLIPGKDPAGMEIFMDSRYFHSGYAWIFPHNKYLAVGCGADPVKISPGHLKDNFHKWLKQKSFHVSGIPPQSFPLCYDYRGIRFDNVYLTGEAAGLTSGLTGEGIYPALVSGQIAAESILSENLPVQSLEKLLRYKKVQEKYLSFLYNAGPFRNTVFNLTLWFLKNKAFREYVTRGFS